ncbi:M23 family metallopeptidase [Desulfovibrio ferrophilus]|uniref:Peptidase M23 n=1 Tax=Desulfovibrio ferrophilus TaxID=241368 RepID=A0A2Z6AZ98_9BACT|nr:peptidoglycan DD-metalloendopeptidase family protein [Desulfovibrio ferrophilus]BBD08538.1 peptidase M23 [Desulfovibrio ferrophilus]
MFRDRKAERRRSLCAKLACAAIVVAGIAFFVVMVHNPSERHVEMTEADGASVIATESISTPEVQVVSAVEPEPMLDVVKLKIKRGQTAAALLSEFLSPGEIHELNNRSKNVYPLSRMKAGRPYRIVSRLGELERFEYEISGEEMLVVARGGAGYDILKEPIVYDTETRVVRGRIDSSLFGAVSDCGESPALAVRLSEIFAWDIDFIRDIRTGDMFSAVVEKRFRDGKFSGYGTIEAAEFVNQGESFKGFLFADKHGIKSYYDENGRSLRKAFLKAPLNFSRISSGFNLRRLHPVLKIRRPHPGIDYAAPMGTPVKTVGDGLIIKKGWDKGGGRYLKIRHNSVYETTYMHLKGFAKGMKQGVRVKQGQVIAYVGSSGMSTGPHLDFRMKKSGSFVNPRRIKSPSCAPIAEKQMAEFETLIGPLLAKLESAGVMHADAAAATDAAANAATAADAANTSVNQ